MDDLLSPLFFILYFVLAFLIASLCLFLYRVGHWYRWGYSFIGSVRKTLKEIV